MKRRKSRRTKRTKRLSRRLGTMLFWMNIMALFFVAWTVNCETKAHVTPSWPLTELAPLLSKPELSQWDYQTLFRQTGLAPMTIDKLRARERDEEIYEAQRLYFQEVTVKCEPNTVISREEYLVDQEGNPDRGMRIMDVEDGDILITYCSHTFGWRNGHAALVIDAENRLTLEAQVLGEPSKILSLDHWEEYPSFLVLRLTDASSRVRSEAARYAKENLVGIPYRLTAGIREAAGSWPERNIVKRNAPDMGDYVTVDAGKREADNALEPEQLNADSQETVNVSGTQCAHLVWYVYARFGYDLDSDGGVLVTPYDLENSPLLEVVQVYGMQRDY